MSRSRLWLIVIALAAVYVAWGSTYLAIRYAIAEMPPFAMCALRFVIAGLLLVGLGRLRGEPWPGVAAEWRGAAIAGILMLGLANGAVTLAERTVPSGVAALIAASTPLILAVIERVRRDGERSGHSGNAGLALGFGGVAILLWPGLTGSTAFGEPIDLAILLVAPLCWAAGTAFAKRHLLPAGLLVGAGLQTLTAGLFHTVLAAVTGELPRALHGYGPSTWQAIAYLVLVGSLVGYTAFAFLVREVPPSLASSNAYVNPVVAVILGSAIAHEAVTSSILLGSVMVVGAVLLLAWPQWALARRARVEVG